MDMYQHLDDKINNCSITNLGLCQRIHHLHHVLYICHVIQYAAGGVPTGLSQRGTELHRFLVNISPCPFAEALLQMHRFPHNIAYLRKAAIPSKYMLLIRISRSTGCTLTSYSRGSGFKSQTTYLSTTLTVQS